MSADKTHKIERVQLGVRMEKRLVKVLKAMAEYHDMSLGDLMEGIILHAMEGRNPFDQESITNIEKLKEIYGMDYDSTAAHNFIEQEE
jgi:predicted DNA-binding ribbon-helix-helix protein